MVQKALHKAIQQINRLDRLFASTSKLKSYSTYICLDLLAIFYDIIIKWLFGY